MNSSRPSPTQINLIFLFRMGKMVWFDLMRPMAALSAIWKSWFSMEERWVSGAILLQWSCVSNWRSKLKNGMSEWARQLNLHFQPTQLNQQIKFILFDWMSAGSGWNEESWWIGGIVGLGCSFLLWIMGGAQAAHAPQREENNNTKPTKQREWNSFNSTGAAVFLVGWDEMKTNQKTKRIELEWIERRPKASHAAASQRQLQSISLCEGDWWNWRR